MSDRKTAYLISASDHYDHRFAVMDRVLKRMGYETIYVTSDFDHTRKETYVCSVPGCVQLHARAYQKNLSVDRILSHFLFARSVFHYLDGLDREPDAVVTLLPPNFLACFCAKFKRRHPNVKLLFDIFDMWPETFPSNQLKRLLAPAFSVWAWIRDRYLPAADYVITECEMFREKLGLSEDCSETIYLSAPALEQPVTAPILRNDRLELCYLGAINNIIDIPAICQLIRDMVKVKPILLHIIGKGERQQELVDSAEAAGAQVQFHGAIYDENAKRKILEHCHFGLNVMKSSVFIGLSMKSVDYFRYGLPIINTIPGDTERLLMSAQVGVQLNADGIEYLRTLSNEACMQMHKNAEQVFAQYFSNTVIEKQYQNLLERIL